MVRISLFSGVVIISQVAANGEIPGFLDFPSTGISRTSSYSSSSISVRGADGKLHTESQEMRDEGIDDGSGPRHARAAVACKDLLCKGRLQRQTPEEGVVNSHMMSFRKQSSGLAPKDTEFDSDVRKPGLMDSPGWPNPSMGMNMGMGIDEDDNMDMNRKADAAALSSPFADAGRITQSLQNMGHMMRNIAKRDNASDAHSESVASSYAYTKKGDEEREAAQITHCKNGACETKTLKTPQEDAKSDTEKMAKSEASQKDAGKA